MKHKIKRALSHPLISWSSIVLVGSFLANIFNYIFNLLLGGRQLLSVSDYGLYMALTSIFGLFATFSIAFSGIFAKFSAKYYAAGDLKASGILVKEGFKFICVFSLVVLVILSFLIPVLLSFLHINDYKLVVLVILSIITSILSSLPLGVLQGEMRFYLLTFITGISPIIKIILGVLMIILGLKIFGVMIAIFLSIIIPYIFITYYIFNKYKISNLNTVNAGFFLKELKDYSLKFFLASFGMIFISYADIILVRHFFDPVSSGHYAALSLMGKVIFYITSPIYMVFFPLVAQKKEKKEKLFNTLILAVAIVFLVSSGMSFVYFLFPGIILKIFFPAKDYLILSSFLGPFSLYILVFSMANLFCSFLLSIGKTGIYKINLFAIGFLIFLVSFFHQSLYQIIGVLFFISFLLLLMLLVYYYYHGRD